jgi:ribosomal protein S18 acetylase RimI-like enzyme
VSYEPLEWDSRFFGVPIGRVPAPHELSQITAAASQADANGIACLYLLLDVADVDGMHTAIECGFRPYDVRIELGYRLQRSDLGAVAEIRTAQAADLPDVEQLARDAFTQTRFSADARFPRALVRELYAAWARRGMQSAPQRLTFISATGTGFITCHFDRAAGLGTIELIGVAGSAAGHGLAGALVRYALGAFGDSGLDRATVVTQGRNTAALRLYERCGFRCDRIGVWLHRWREDHTPPGTVLPQNGL